MKILLKFANSIQQFSVDPQLSIWIAIISVLIMALLCLKPYGYFAYAFRYNGVFCCFFFIISVIIISALINNRIECGCAITGFIGLLWGFASSRTQYVKATHKEKPLEFLNLIASWVQPLAFAILFKAGFLFLTYIIIEIYVSGLVVLIYCNVISELLDLYRLIFFVFIVKHSFLTTKKLYVYYKDSPKLEYLDISRQVAGDCPISFELVLSRLSKFYNNKAQINALAFLLVSISFIANNSCLLVGLFFLSLEFDGGFCLSFYLMGNFILSYGVSTPWIQRYIDKNYGGGSLFLLGLTRSTQFCTKCSGAIVAYGIHLLMI